VNRCSIKFIYGNEYLLEKVKPLWEALNRYNLGLSANFKQHYKDMTFEKRKADLLKKAAAGKMRVDLAVDQETKQAVGYCVSSLNQEKIGEVESIFIDADYRGLGIGDLLMQKALFWMDHEGVNAKILEVAAGNEEAFGFYARYGFLPRKILLKQENDLHGTYFSKGRH